MGMHRRLKSWSSAASKANRKIWSNIGHDGKESCNPPTSVTINKSEEAKGMEETYVTTVKNLFAQADETDNQGKFEEALEQYSAIRDLIKVSPTFHGGLAAIDAKTAFSMGMIHEFEYQNYAKAEELYEEALSFYSKTYSALQKQSGERTFQNHMKIRHELNERISAILLRLAVSNGKQQKWTESLDLSTRAYDTFLKMDFETFPLAEGDTFEKQIQDQIFLSEAKLEKKKKAQARDDIREGNSASASSKSISQPQQHYGLCAEGLSLVTDFQDALKFLIWST